MFVFPARGNYYFSTSPSPTLFLMSPKIRIQQERHRCPAVSSRGEPTWVFKHLRGKGGVEAHVGEVGSHHMLKRVRGEDEMVEAYAALLRQSGARAIERIRQRRGNSISGVMPIDALVLQYAMWFLDLRAFPAVSYVTQAQRTVAEAIERVSYPHYFSSIPLSTLVESLVSENTAAVMQQTITLIEEFIEARNALGRWIDENINTTTMDDYTRYGRSDDGGEEDMDVALERAGILWRSALFWVAVLEYIEALSLSSAKVNAFALRPRYEQELMELLNSIATPKGSTSLQPHQVAYPPKNSPSMQLDAGNTNIISNGLSGATLRDERVCSDATTVPVVEPAKVLCEARTEEVGNGSSVVVSTLLADLMALANCPADSPATGGGMNPTFFTMVHARLNVVAACQRLDRFSREARVAPPPLTEALQSLQLQREALAAGRNRRVSNTDTSEDMGLPLDFVANEAYMRAALEKENVTLDEDEELFEGEITDYYKGQQQQQQSVPLQQDKRKTKCQPPGSDVVMEPAALMKPHRFCKVKTGYTWTQYNRTHYDIRTNPPPRGVLWYEFTLFYPALANTKRDMSRIYRIEDTSRGPNDDYCVLVFSVGPPYADVAYQIVRKQWDPRPGGVRASFDSSGTYRLFFRFTNSNYRR
uniref:Uncharacterized protein TCIL3000_11_12200 n=1 Tax=Trypanosoma congolense (strain IL3000) TaxID=1068625 RepID=G0V255_TRYCI|nr:unnamed protein product [Trypanosoma congolense IL3000]